MLLEGLGTERCHVPCFLYYPSHIVSLELSLAVFELEWLPNLHPRTSQPAYIFRCIPGTLHFTLHIIYLSGQLKPCPVHDRIPRLIRYKLKLLALLVLSLLAGDKKGPGLSIHPSMPLVIPNLSIPHVILNLSIPLVDLNLSIPLVVLNLSITLVVLNRSIPLIFQMANLMTKRKTMLNSLTVRYPI